MSETALRLVGASLEAGGKTLFTVDELDVKRGEVLCVIGPNGAGKSSLLKVLGLLERPTRGRLLLNGDEVGGGNLVALRRRMATVFQEPLLYDATVYENVAAGLKFRRTKRQEIRSRVMAALDLLGIDDLASQRARSLSGGEAQRVNLARALVLEPEVFLLDEPFGGLDPEAARKLLEDLRHLVHGRRITTVFVTHDRSEALAIADRVAVLMGGRVVQVGQVEEVFGRPATPEVASFVGVETVLSGEVFDGDDGSCLVDVGGGNRIAAATCGEGSVFVCIRPEDVTLVPAGVDVQSSARNRFKGRVIAISALGPQYRIELDCGFPLVCFVTKQAVEELDLDVGSEVGAVFKATAVHILKR